MADINIEKAPQNIAVLPFYGTGAFFFLLLTFLLFFSADDLRGFYFTPHLLAIVHTAALGWGSMVIFGAAYQLLPVICERELFSVRLAFISYILLFLGVSWLVAAFWYFIPGGLMITGGALVFSAALCYLVNLGLTAGACKKYTVVKGFIYSSAIWLVITTGIGLLLAINLRYPFITGDHLNILKLHAHAGLAGWFLQLITGVSAKMVPMFLLGKSKKEKLLQSAFLLQNAGLLLFEADAFFAGLTARVLLYALLLAAGIGCWLLYLYDAYRYRMKKVIDTGMKHTMLSFIGLLAALLLIPVIYYSTAPKWSILYGTLLFLGWISGIILGKTFKTLPFIIWNEHYRKLNGKVKVPMPKHLYAEGLLKYQFGAYIIALLLLVAGILTGSMPVIRGALLVFIGVACCYCLNVAKVLMHKTRTADGNISK